MGYSLNDAILNPWEQGQNDNHMMALYKWKFFFFKFILPFLKKKKTSQSYFYSLKASSRSTIGPISICRDHRSSTATTITYDGRIFKRNSFFVCLKYFQPSNTDPRLETSKTLSKNPSKWKTFRFFKDPWEVFLFYFILPHVRAPLWTWIVRRASVLKGESPFDDGRRPSKR